MSNYEDTIAEIRALQLEAEIDIDASMWDGTTLHCSCCGQALGTFVQQDAPCFCEMCNEIVRLLMSKNGKIEAAR